MAMEKHTSSDYTLTFYNVQPITYSLKFMRTLNTLKMKKNITDSYATDNTSAWLETFQDIGNAYQSLSTLKIAYPSALMLVQDLKDPRYFVNGSLSLVEHFVPDETSASLHFDQHTQTFILVYCIVLKTDAKTLQVLSETAEPKGDFYNTIRKLVVRERVDDAISQWASHVEDASIETARSFIRDAYGIKTIPDDAIVIKTNTGNITNFVSTTITTDLDIVQQKFIKLNDYAERRDYSDKPIELNDGTLYYFNGRFHTIFLVKDYDIMRFVPIQFHMQYMWIYTLEMYALMDYVSKEMIVRSSQKKLKKLNSLIDAIIQKVQYLSLFHDNFKRALEADNKNVYEKIERLWHINSTLEGTEQYVVNFKDYLSRKHLAYTSRVNHRQSNILFLISMLQMISLVGVWSSYISLIDRTDFESHDFLLRIFGSQQNILRFNMYLPIFFMGLILMLIISGYINRKKL